MINAVYALYVASMGLFINASTFLLAQTETIGTDLAPYVTAGGTISAVGGLSYVARLLAKGDLVARPTAEREDKLLDLIDRLERTAESLSGMAEESHNREREFVSILREGRRYEGGHHEE